MKSSKIIFWIIAAFIAVLVIYIGKESLTQPGMQRFRGELEEFSTYRNENNTGPVVRIFAVKSHDASKDLMRDYGDAMPHNKYGRTVVFFFTDEVNQAIELSPTDPYFSEELRSKVIATYLKSPMGEVSFVDGYPK